MANWRKLAELVKEARDQLELTQEQAAARTGGRVAASNWRMVESAGRQSYRTKTLRGIEIALGWREGAAMEVVNGKAKTLADLGRETADLGDTLAKLDELDAAIAALRDEVNRKLRSSEAARQGKAAPRRGA